MPKNNMTKLVRDGEVDSLPRRSCVIVENNKVSCSIAIAETIQIIDRADPYGFEKTIIFCLRERYDKNIQYFADMKRVDR